MKLSFIRKLFASFFFGTIFFFFLDFAGILPFELHILTHIQIIPAILGSSIGILGGLFLLSLLFGRLYCSTICPLGVLQDLIIRMSRFYSKRAAKSKKNKGKSYKKSHAYQYLQAHPLLQNSILILSIFSIIMGWTAVISLLDPYSIFGRTTTHLFKPFFLLLNNGLAAFGNKIDNYTLYNVPVVIVGGLTASVTLCTIGLVIVFAIRSGRLYCNTICPVGTLLGWISRISLFRIHFDTEKCNQCGNCERVCKSSCIDSKIQKIDLSRCVSCYNCLNHCSKGAIHYSLAFRNSKKNATKTENESKRRFLTTIGFLSLSIPIAKANSVLHRQSKRKVPIAPPGAISHEHLNQHCTACHLCIAKCPNHIIQPAAFEYGMGGIMQPVLNFDKGFCNFDCTLCSSVCPNGALKPIALTQKHRLQIGRVKLDLDRCVVKTDHTNCGACSEHCPTQAVEMIPYQGALTIPYIHPEICVGCGGCEFICPVQPNTAIYVDGLDQHQVAREIKKENKKDVQLNDFGF